MDNDKWNWRLTVIDAALIAPGGREVLLVRTPFSPSDLHFLCEAANLLLEKNRAAKEK